MRMHARGALFRLFSSPGHSKRGLGKAGRFLFDIMSINGISHSNYFLADRRGSAVGCAAAFCFSAGSTARHDRAMARMPPCAIAHQRDAGPVRSHTPRAQPGSCLTAQSHCAASQPPTHRPGPLRHTLHAKRHASPWRAKSRIKMFVLVSSSVGLLGAGSWSKDLTLERSHARAICSCRALRATPSTTMTSPTAVSAHCVPSMYSNSR